MNPEIWRDIFDAIEDPAFLHDKQFRVLLANAAYCRVAGVTEAQALGKPYWEVFPPGTGPLPGCKAAMDRKGHGGSQEEVSVGAKLFLSKGYTARDDQGKYLYSLHLLSDISAQRQATAESEERFRRATETARDAIIILDGVSGAVTAWNPAAEVIFGYGKEEVIGRVLNDFLPPPRFREAMTKGMAHFATTGEGATIGQTLELAALHKNGTEFPIELSLSAAQIHGKWHATGIARDITERKRAETALRENQARLDLALRSASMGVWHSDMIENRRYFDDQTCRLLGIDPATFTGAAEEFFGAVHPDDRETIKAALARTMEQDIPYEPEYRAVWPDGSIHYLTSRGRLLRDDKGRPVKLNGIIWDISERKQGELELGRANRALRTLSACNEALVHAENESELLDSICRLVVKTGGYHMAWVGFPEQDAAKTVRPVAQYGYDEAFLAVANISWADTELGRNPVGTAIRTGTFQVNQRFRTNLAPWREAAQPRGYQSSIALPLKNSAGTLGVLSIYASEPDAFSEAEVTLLQELAADLAFGIETLRARIEHDRIVHEHLHHAEILMQSLEDSIKAIAATVEMRDAYTAGHQRRVGQLAVAIARELGLPEGTSRGIELAASIHDLGKISVPAEILSKPSKLTDLELMLVKTHAQAGYDILKDIKFPWPIATMVWQHHERLDGSGYPQGLKGDQILLESRIMAVADVVEAMASHRPYRAALGIDIALKEIEQGRGTAYDAAVVDACIRLFAEKRFAFSI